MSKVLAKLNFVRLSPDKIRPILPLIKGKKPEEALAILNNLPHKGAHFISKLLNCAVAAAKEKNLEVNKLYISQILCNEGPRLKRFRIGSRGRSYSILKKSSHINLTLAEKEALVSKAKPKQEDKKAVLRPKEKTWVKK